MKISHIIDEIEYYDPEVFERLNTRRWVKNRFFKRIAAALAWLIPFQGL